MADGAEFQISNDKEDAGPIGSQLTPSPLAVGDQLSRDLKKVAATNMEAVSASTEAAARGAEALIASAMAFTRTTLQDHHAIAKAMITAPNLQDAMALQAEFTRKFRLAYMAQLYAVTEILTDTAQSSTKPLNDRATDLAKL